MARTRQRNHNEFAAIFSRKKNNAPQLNQEQESCIYLVTWLR